MAQYKIGITEAGDAGIDLSWTDKMDSVDGAILITKCISQAFINAALEYKEKIIIHATLTGYGSSVLESNVPSPKDEYKAICSLIEQGFTKEKIVIRIDPIIPTNKGLKVAFNVFKKFIDNGFKRFKVSIIDMYPHARSRFTQAGITLPYDNNGFSPSKQQINNTNDMLKSVKEYYVSCNNDDELRIESCAEPDLTESIICGCISEYDLKMLNLDINEIDNTGFQRRNCLCYSGKTELLNNKKRCKHGCLYCYWKNN